MNNNELLMLQALPLNIKVGITKIRVSEWVEYYGVDNVYISFSGGKDSTVLAHIVRSLYPSVPLVFVDTGLEYPEIKQFVKKQDNVTILRPKMSFKQVIEKYGYPMTSKAQARYLHDMRYSTEKMKLRRINGDSKGRYKLAKKYYYLIDAPFAISAKCCDVMKKQPAKLYEKHTDRVPFIGTLACESLLRKQVYMKYGCNAFNNSRPASTPLGFWTEQDILRYIKENNIEIAQVYGEIIEEDGLLKTTGLDNTGCIFCGFGIDYDGEPNRYQRLEKTHPQLHDYCMNKLGFKEVCEFMNIKYKGDDNNE